jgi:hypothetical protein
MAGGAVDVEVRSLEGICTGGVIEEHGLFPPLRVVAVRAVYRVELGAVRLVVRMARGASRLQTQEGSIQSLVLLLERSDGDVRHVAVLMAPSAIDSLVPAAQPERLQIVIEVGFVEPPYVKLPAQVFLVTCTAVRLVESRVEAFGSIDYGSERCVTSQAQLRGYPSLPELVAGRTRPDSL